MLMKMIRSMSFVALVLLAATACGTSSGVSPTMPSDASSNSPGSAATGATIAGTVNVNLGGAALMRTEAAGSGLTVAVVGTTISSTVDRSGHFELKGVPSGTIELRFTGGAGIDARLLIIAVIESERIQVTVAVNGATARLITIERTRAASAEVELKGAASSVSGSCPALTLVVNGTTVTTTASTQFKDGSCSVIAVGRQVEVKGTRQANGTVLASRVEIEEKEAEKEEVEVKGTVSSVSGSCPSVTLTVNGTTITTGPATQFKHGGCGSLRSGIKVEVEGTRQANGSVLASKVEIDDDR